MFALLKAFGKGSSRLFSPAHVFLSTLFGGKKKEKAPLVNRSLVKYELETQLLLLRRLLLVFEAPRFTMPERRALSELLRHFLPFKRESGEKETSKLSAV